MLSKLLRATAIACFAISNWILAQSAPPPEQSSASTLPDATQTRTDATQPVSVGQDAERARDLQYHLSLANVFVTLDTLSRYGLGASKIYSQPGKNIELNVIKWTSWQTYELGFGLFGSTQFMDFERSRDGRRDGAKLTPFRLEAGLYPLRIRNFSLGVFGGLHNDIVAIAPPATNTVVGIASTLAYGFDLSGDYAFTDLWKIVANFKQFMTEPTKVKGVKIERGASYCVQAGVARAMTPQSSLTLAYRFCEASQDTAFSRIKKLQDHISIGYDATLDL